MIYKIFGTIQDLIGLINGAKVRVDRLRSFGFKVSYGICNRKTIGLCAHTWTILST